jgi:Gram-negative bacterial TonB protein C-terminal
MKLRNFIIIKLAFGFWLLVFGFCSADAQKIAVITPEKSEIATKISLELSDKLNALDSDLVEKAFQSTTYERVYNLTTNEAKSIGSAIGCDFYVLLKSETLRRNSFEKREYFESYAAIYLVNSKSGHLVFWKIYSFADKKIEIAEQKLFSEINIIATTIKDNLKSEKTEKPIIAEFSEDDKTLRSPLPYKRLKPAYTILANLYSIAATIDIEVDLNEKGEITRTEILRWAGFGLDESVIETVKKMNWRPAIKDGKTLPIRVLLRYNFKKVEKDE